TPSNRHSGWFSKVARPERGRKGFRSRNIRRTDRRTFAHPWTSRSNKEFPEEQRQQQTISRRFWQKRTQVLLPENSGSRSRRSTGERRASDSLRSQAGRPFHESDARPVIRAGLRHWRTR